MVAKMAQLGIVAGAPFDRASSAPMRRKTLATVAEGSRFEKIMAWFKDAVSGGRCHVRNGWLFTTKTGLYGTNYLQRALVTAIGLGANRPQDAVYPTSEVDADGKPYSGANKYVMHFDKGSCRR